MNTAAIENGITSALASKLAPRGFRQLNSFLISRNRAKVTEQIRCGIRVEKSSGKSFVSVLLGIRFNDVEEFLGHDDPDSPTITLPIHLLHQNNALAEWDIAVRETTQILVQEVETFGIPFFEKYIDPHIVLLSLQSDNPRNWFILTPEARVETLCAILVLQNQKGRALEFLEEQIITRRNKPIGQRLRLEKLRERILSSVIEG